MARIKIILPDKSIASFIIPVRINDINYGNHVGNDAFISLMHEARMQWLRLYDLTELSISGSGLIMAGLTVEFIGESVYGDMVQVDLYVGEITGVKFDLFYRLSTVREGENIALANALTVMVSYNYDLTKVVAIPEILRNILKKE